MTTKLVIFDLAGTTVKDLNFVPGALVKAFSKEGMAITLEEANKVMGIPKPVAINQILLAQPVEASEEMVETIHQSFLEEIIGFYRTSTEVEETEGVSETFGILKNNNIKIGINTGFDRRTTDVLLKRLKWLEEDLIDAVVTSDEVEKGRPFPDMIYKIMKLTGIENPAQVAKVGDTESDLLEGTAAKCGIVIGVTTGAYSEEDLRKFPHTHLIQKIPQLLEFLEMEK